MRTFFILSNGDELALSLISAVCKIPQRVCRPFSMDRKPAALFTRRNQLYGAKQIDVFEGDKALKLVKRLKTDGMLVFHVHKGDIEQSDPAVLELLRCDVVLDITRADADAVAIYAETYSDRVEESPAG